MIKTAQTLKSQLPVIPDIRARVACELFVDKILAHRKVQEVLKNVSFCFKDHLLTLNKEAGVIHGLLPWWKDGQIEITTSHGVGLQWRTTDEISYFFRNYQNLIIKEFIGCVRSKHYSLYFGG